MSKKETIIDVAENLFAEHGYTYTSIDDIASECGITKAAIYYHFKNKQELYSYILVTNFKTLADAIEKRVSSVEDTEKKFEAYVVTLARELEKNKNTASLIMREMANGGDDMPDIALKQMLRTFKMLTSIVQKGNEEKKFKCIEPMLIQMMVLGSLSFLITTQDVRHKVKSKMDEDARTVFEYTFQEAALKISHTLLISLHEK